MFDFIILCPSGSPDATVPIAGSRAGALGLVNLEFAADLDAGLAQLRRLCELGRGRCGALVDDQEVLAAVLDAALEGLDVVVLANTPFDQLSVLVQRVHEAGLQAYVVATRYDEAVAAEDAGADAVIAKGHEAGGWISDEGSFVLCQRLLAKLSTPVYVHGGIGAHTVAAAYVCGAAGAVLDAQLLLARESPLPEGLKAALAGVDGSETVTLGAELGATFRAYSRQGPGELEQLRALEHELTPSAESLRRWRSEVKTLVGESPVDAGVLALGQDAALADDLARRFGNVAGMIDGLLRGDRELMRDARAGQPAGGGRRRGRGPPQPLSDRAGADDARQRPRGVRRRGGRRRRAAVPGARADARPGSRRAAGPHRRAGRRAIVGGWPARLRARGPARGAAAGRTRAQTAVCADRRRASRPGARARSRRNRDLPARAIAGAA